MSRFALIAHDAKKDDMASFVFLHEAFFRKATLFATASTARCLISVLSGLLLTSLKSGPEGGDQQVGALICEGKIDALFFFVDPMSSFPHDVDVKALTRLAVYYNIPLALNASTAKAVLLAAAKDPAHAMLQ